MSVEEELQEPLLERLSATSEPEAASENTQKDSKKRKREKDLPETKKSAKKPKSKKKAKEEEEDDLDLELCINKAFSHMDHNLLADYIARRTRRYGSDLSSIELEDRSIPGLLRSRNDR